MSAFGWPMNMFEGRLGPMSTSVGAATVHDVAAYILENRGRMTAMKLQKLVYYSQAWSVVWDQRPLFDEAIEAWANGPVVRDLYETHRGQYIVSRWPKGDPTCLDTEAIRTIDAVLEYYGNRSPQWLSDLTHLEDPWQQARTGLAPGERGDREITLASLEEYYGGLSPDGEQQ